MTYVQAQPNTSLAGGVGSPSASRVTFRIDGRPAGTVNVTVNGRSRTSASMGVWKLIYSGRSSISATNTMGVVGGIKDTGEITIQWVYSNPDPRASEPAQ